MTMNCTYSLATVEMHILLGDWFMTSASTILTKLSDDKRL